MVKQFNIILIEDLLSEQKNPFSLIIISTLLSRPCMCCTTEYRVNGPVTKVIQKDFALPTLAPRQKIEDTFHARGSLAARQKEGWGGKVRRGAPGSRPRGKDVSGRAVGISGPRHKR